jgi:hypothetical protein
MLKTRLLKYFYIYCCQTEQSLFFVYLSTLVNDTNIIFTQEELKLLSKGLAYNLHYKYKNWIQTLALEAATAINNFNPWEQDIIRYKAAQNIKSLYKKCGHSKSNIRTDKYEKQILNQIKGELLERKKYLMYKDQHTEEIGANVKIYNLQEKFK